MEQDEPEVACSRRREAWARAPGKLHARCASIKPTLHSFPHQELRLSGNPVLALSKTGGRFEARCVLREACSYLLGLPSILSYQSYLINLISWGSHQRPSVSLSRAVCTRVPPVPRSSPFPHSCLLTSCAVRATHHLCACSCIRHPEHVTMHLMPRSLDDFRRSLRACRGWCT